MRAVIPLQEIEPRTDSSCCGHCSGIDKGQHCQGAEVLGHCASPLLQGSAAPLERALAALAKVIEPESQRSVVERGLITSLQVDDDNVELTLTVMPQCGSGRWISAACFEALRAALPDTDVFVGYAGAARPE